MSTTQRDIEAVIKEAINQNWRHQRTSSGHHQFYAPDGKGIVVASKTPSDHRDWENFMSEMKRNGYRDGLATLGDFLPPKQANGGGKLTVSQYVVDLLSRHEEGLSPADISAYIRSQRPDCAPNATSVALSQLMAKGQVSKLPDKRYCLAPRNIVTTNCPRSPECRKGLGHSGSCIDSPATNGVTGTEHLGLVPPAIPPPVQPPEELEVDVDEDIKALDTALVALAHIEGVVRRNREVLKQLAQLRKLLGGIKL